MEKSEDDCGFGTLRSGPRWQSVRRKDGAGKWGSHVKYVSTHVGTSVFYYRIVRILSYFHYCQPVHEVSPIRSGSSPFVLERKA